MKSEDKDKDLQISPRGSSRTRTFLEDNNTAREMSTFKVFLYILTLHCVVTVNKRPTGLTSNDTDCRYCQHCLTGEPTNPSLSPHLLKFGMTGVLRLNNLPHEPKQNCP